VVSGSEDDSDYVPSEAGSDASSLSPSAVAEILKRLKLLESRVPVPSASLGVPSYAAAPARVSGKQLPRAQHTSVRSLLKRGGMGSVPSARPGGLAALLSAAASRSRLSARDSLDADHSGSDSDDSHVSRMGRAAGAEAGSGVLSSAVSSDVLDVGQFVGFMLTFGSVSSFVHDREPAIKRSWVRKELDQLADYIDKAIAYFIRVNENEWQKVEFFVSMCERLVALFLSEQMENDVFLKLTSAGRASKGRAA
jgi:hypothetical protein